MQIGAVSFRPYIYNANRISAGSLSRISAIGDDLTSGKTDFSALSDESLNENPLKKGQTVNFGDVLERQMWEGRQNASRIMRPDEEIGNLEEAEEVLNDFDAVEASGKTENPENASVRAAAASVKNSAKELSAVEVEKDFRPAGAAEEMFRQQPERNLYQMQRAIDAYQMNMTA